jgi:hypothetical protein
MYVRFLSSIHSLVSYGITAKVFLFEETEFEENIIALLKAYKCRNFKNAEFNIGQISNFASSIMQVEVDWYLKDDLNVLFSSFKCIYQLAIIEECSNIRIFGVLNVNELVAP